MADRDRSFSKFVTHRHHLRDILKSKVDNFKMDIIGGLYEMNLSHLCYDIFSQLDSRSFANSRLVSKTWKDFIDYEFDKPKGRKWMREKLQQNYLDNDFCKRVSCAKIHPFLNGISKDRLLIDKDGICVMNDISGEIHMYENDSLNLKWKRNFSSYTVKPLVRCKNVMADGSISNDLCRQVFDQVEMNEKRIFALIDKKKLFFICRETGQILHRIDQPMEKFGQFDDKFLYTLVPLNPKLLDDDYDEYDKDFGEFKILFYDISHKIPPNQIFANESDSRIIHVWGYGQYGDSDTTTIKEDKIIGIHCEEQFESYYLISWNITTGKEIFRVSMMNVEIVMPYTGTLKTLSKVIDTDGQCFYIKFDWDGILEWPYVGFSVITLCKPYMPSPGTFIIDATTGVGKLFARPLFKWYDLKFHMDIAMIHIPRSWEDEQESRMWMFFLKMNDFLSEPYRKEHRTWRNVIVNYEKQYPNVFDLKSVRSKFLAAFGRILYMVVFEDSGIYLFNWNFWS